MDRRMWPDWFSTGSRILGIALLTGVLLAACGDDDDDTDGDALDVTPTVELTSPAGGGGASTPGEATATVADGEATEPEMDMTATTDDTAMTAEEDASSTTDDSSGTVTEDASDEGTPTDDVAGETSTADDGTPTADDAAEGAATMEEPDSTATADDGAGVATDDDATGNTADMGEAVEIDGFSITVDDVETFVGLPGVFEADEGNELIALTLTIENSADADELSILRALSSMHLEDAAGERYEVDLVATALLIFNQEGIMDAQVEAGAEVSGKIGFQVPTDTSDLTLVIEPDDSESTTVELSDELQ